jgi:hypothetical protein
MQPFGPGIELIKSDASGVVLELQVPSYQSHELILDGVTYDRLTAPGCSLSAGEGLPQLPVRGVVLAVPPGSEVELRVLESDERLLPGQYRIPPNPRWAQDLAPFLPAAGQADLPSCCRDFEYVEDDAVFGVEAFYPGPLARVVEVASRGRQRVARLEMHPFQYNPISRQLRMVQRMVIEVAFSYRPRWSPPPGPTDIERGELEPTLRSSLLNIDSAQQWQEPGTPPAAQAAVEAGPWVPPVPGYKIFVDQDGIYSLDFTDLNDAGVLDANPDPRTFQLFNQGQEVAIHVEGEGDGSFGAGDVLLFYGRAWDTRYTTTNVYWLTYGQTGQGARMGQRDGTPSLTPSVAPWFTSTVHAEDNPSYFSRMPGDDHQDRWYWGTSVGWNDPLAPLPLVSWTTPPVDLQLHNLASGSYTASIRVQLYGASEEGHHCKLYVNGHQVDEAGWVGETGHFFDSRFDSAHLLEGGNAVEVECWGVAGNTAFDIVRVDWLEVDYRRTYVVQGDQLHFFGREGTQTWDYHVSDFSADLGLQVFDVTDQVSVERIANVATSGAPGDYTLEFSDAMGHREYWALAPAQRLSPTGIELDTPSDLQGTAPGTDYIIVTHADFYTDVVPVADHRAAQGMTALIADVQDAYDEFSYGVLDVRGIRDFLAHAYDPASDPWQYVVLVGDGHYDYKDNAGYGKANFLPPWMAGEIDRVLGETASDNRYVCTFVGNDCLPRMHIGRLPANTPADAQAMVSKILDYEAVPPPAGAGGWNSQVLFVADNQPDDAGAFWDYADVISSDYLPSSLTPPIPVQYLPSPYTPQKVYYDPSPNNPVALQPPYYIQHPPPRPQPSYYQNVGTATGDIKAAMGEGRLLVNYVGHGAGIFWAAEELFHVDDIPSLASTPTLPVILPMTCQEGFFVYPQTPESDFATLGESIVRAPGKGAVASWSPTGWGTTVGHDFLHKGFYLAVFHEDIRAVGEAATFGKVFLYDSPDPLAFVNRDLIETYLLFGDPAMPLNTIPVDLGITKTVEPEPDGAPFTGDILTYTLTYTNAGPATAHNVVVSDTLPDLLTDPVVVSSGAVITPRVGTQFVWDVADLAAGEGGTITITARVRGYRQGVYTVTNRAVIFTSARESNPENNATAPVATQVRTAPVGGLTMPLDLVGTLLYPSVRRPLAAAAISALCLLAASVGGYELVRRLHTRGKAANRR